MTNCAVSNCESPRAKREWCGMHYQRWWKHGDPEYQLPHHTQCQIPDCSKKPRSAISGLCEMHYVRRYRHGDPLAKIDTRRPDAKYRSAHARITTDRGRADSYQCVDCSQQAEQWSYTHLDADALTSPGGQDYSLDTSFYEPRCRSCHAIFDGTGANQFTSA